MAKDDNCGHSLLAQSGNFSSIWLCKVNRQQLTELSPNLPAAATSARFCPWEQIAWQNTAGLCHEPCLLEQGLAWEMQDTPLHQPQQPATACCTSYLLC